MISSIVLKFVHSAIQKGYLSPLDETVTINGLLHALRQDDFVLNEENTPDAVDKTLQETPKNTLNVTLQSVAREENLLELKDKLVAYAISQELIQDTLAQKEQFGAYLMSFVTPLPSVLNQQFWEKYQKAPQEATDYFYQLSQDNDYIKIHDIAKNIQFTYNGKYGELHITINLSKPEKDPKDIMLAGKAKASSYPASPLDMTNEGYYGRANHPARSQHRIIRLNLNGDAWGLQYSPYAYFDEHCIFLSEVVRPMHIDRVTFSNLLTLVDMFPYYCVGSNAGLPIVGGSILSHDHYQAGRYTFPMELAKADYSVAINGVTIQVINWAMSTLRLYSTDKETLLDVAEFILTQWQQYTNEAIHILASSNGEAHNTITPIARWKNGGYELDLVLRNNRTSPEYPDGIFHPHSDVQHIKKENIGLIEVMGLAILPPRLKAELQEVEAYLLGHCEQVNPIHQQWADSLERSKDPKQVRRIVEDGVGAVFERVLEDAGVFKRDERGQAALREFVEGLVKNYEIH